MNEITNNKKLTSNSEDLIIDKNILLEDKRNEGETKILIKKDIQVIYKSYFNTNKIFILEKNASLKYYEIGKNIHTTINLQGENAECEINGLLIGSGKWSIHTTHQNKLTKSNILIRTIVDKKEKSEIDGLITINEACPKSEGHESIKNLMLDKSAIVKAIPRLKISTDDVICTHDATISQLKENDLFYLQSRGLTKENAKKLLIEGFVNFNETINEMKNEKENILNKNNN